MSLNRRATLSWLAVMAAVPRVANAEGLVVGVSWSNFQEERWKRDEAALKAALQKLGAKYISADAQGSNEKQLSDVRRLVAGSRSAHVADLTQDDVLSMIILGCPPQRQHATTLPQVTPTSSAASIGPA